MKMNKATESVWIKAKFPCKCGKCGVSIKPRWRAYWNPSTHKVLCARCGTVQEMQEEEDAGMWPHGAAKTAIAVES